MPLKTPRDRVAGICDVDECSLHTDVEVQDSQGRANRNATPLRLCTKHGQPFVLAGLRVLGCEVKS